MDLPDRIRTGSGQDPEAPWVVPLEWVVDTEALRPALSATASGSRLRLSPTDQVISTEWLSEAVSDVAKKMAGL